MSETNGTPPNGYATQIHSRKKLNAEGMREYESFKIRHTALLEDFALLLRHTVVNNRIPVEVITHIVPDSDGKILKDNVRIGTDQLQTTECQDKWKELLAAADKDFRDHPDLREAIKQRLQDETEGLGRSWTKKVGKHERDRAENQGFPHSLSGRHPYY